MNIIYSRLHILKNFYLKQLSDIKSQGIKIFISKLKIFLKLVTIFIPALIIVFLIRIVSPFIIVKIKSLDMARLGEQTLTWYVKLKKIGEFDKKNEFHLFYINNSVSYVNSQWLKMWRKKIIIFPSFIFKYVELINQLLPGNEKHLFPPLQVFHRQLIGREETDDLINEPNIFSNQQEFLSNLKNDSLQEILKIKEADISFGKAELKKGYEILQKMGIEENKYVCFSARDQKFLNRFNQDINWDYQRFRNADVNTYLPALEIMTQKGFHCLRTGFMVKEKLKTNNKKIIDYSNSEDRSDFFDIFLGSQCFFYLLSGGSGIQGIPQAFNKPIVFINHHNINEILYFCHNSLYIPKKYYLIKEKRFLKFAEFIDLERKTNFTRKLHNNLDGNNQIFNNLGIKLFDNSPEEISDIVDEMEKRISGTWEEDKEDILLQNKFWSLFEKRLSYHKNLNYLKSPTFRIGSKFLKKNKSHLF
tara:strand:+ start:217 stop:1638 length:1422 start_codon:yes stop_codon:yes gene_type:complete